MINRTSDKWRNVQLGGEAMGLVNQLSGICRRALLDENDRLYLRALAIQTKALRRYRRRKALLV